MAIKAVKIKLVGDDEQLKVLLAEDKAKAESLRSSLSSMAIKADDKDAAYKIRSLELSTDRLREKMGSARLSVRGYEQASLQLLKLDAQADRLRKTIHVKVDENTDKRGGLLSRISSIGGGSGGGLGSAAGSGGGLLTSPVGIAAIAGAITIGLASLPAIVGAGTTLGVGGLGYMLGNKGLSTIKADRQAVTQAQTSIKGSKNPSPSQIRALDLAQQQLNKDTHGWAGEFAKVGQSFQPVIHQVMGFVHSLGGPLAKMFSASIPGIKSFITALEPAIRQAIPMLTQVIKASAPIMKDWGKQIGQLMLAGVKGLQILSLAFKDSMPVIDAVIKVTSLTIEGLAYVVTAVAIKIGGGLRILEQEFWSVVGWVKRTSSGIASTFRRLPGELATIGRDIMSGLLHGLESAGSSVLSYVGNFVKSIPGKFLSLLGISSPSKVMRGIGNWTMQGLLAGLTGSQAKVKSTVASLAKTVRDDFRNGLLGQGQESFLTSFLSRDNGRLQQLAYQRKKIAGEIKAANAFAKSTKGNILGGFDITSVTNSAGGAPDAGDVMQSLKIDLSQVKTFAGNIRKLQKMGLNHRLLRQIINAGPISGGPVAAALAEASAGSIKNINSEEKQIVDESRRTGYIAADALYDAGKHAGKGFLTGLKAQERNIETEMRKIARVLVNTIRRELKIHSPSQVMHDLGLTVGQGLSLGIDHSQASVALSASRMARGIPMQFGHAYGPSAGYAGAAGGQTTITIKGEGDDLLKMIVKALRYDIQANGGGNVQRYLGRGAA